MLIVRKIYIAKSPYLFKITKNKNGLCNLKIAKVFTQISEFFDRYLPSICVGLRKINTLRKVFLNRYNRVQRGDALTDMYHP